MPFNTSSDGKRLYHKKIIGTLDAFVLLAVWLWSVADVWRSPGR